MEWRHIKKRTGVADMFAIFPSITEAVSQGNIADTIFQGRLLRDAIGLGFFSDPEKDIDIRYCEEHDIEWKMRAVAGGGPVWMGAGQAWIGLFAKQRPPRIPATLGELYEKFLGGIAETLSQRLKIKARYRPVNDIEVRTEKGNWKKIGICSAQSKENAVSIFSAIQVKQVPMQKASRAIVPPPEKFADKDAKSISERMTCLESELGVEISVKDLESLLSEAVAKSFDIKLAPGELTERELKLKRDYHELLTSDESLFGRSERGKFKDVPPDIKRSEVLFKVPQGPFVRITILMDPATKEIYDLLITGAIHVMPLTPQASPIHEMERRLKGVPLQEEFIREKLNEVFKLPGYEIVGASAEDFAKHFMKAISQISKSQTNS